MVSKSMKARIAIKDPYYSVTLELVIAFRTRIHGQMKRISNKIDRLLTNQDLNRLIKTLINF